MGSESGLAWNSILAVARLHDITVITRLTNQEAIERAQLDLPGIRFVYFDRPILRRLKRGAFGARWYYYFWQKGLRKYAKRIAKSHFFDVAHHMNWTGLGQPVGLYKTGMPLVLGPMGGGVSAPPSLLLEGCRPGHYTYEILRIASQKTLLLRPSVRRVLRSADEVLIQNKETARLIGPLRPGGVNVLSYVRSAATAPHFAVDVSDENRKGHRHELLFVGRLVEWKGLGICLRALAALPSELYCLTVIGDGPGRRNFEKLSSRLGLQARVSFLGWRSHDEVLSTMERSSLLLFPSMHEEGGFVVLEALSRGLRPLVLDLGGPQSFADAGAIVVPARPVRTLTERFAAAIECALTREWDYVSGVSSSYSWNSYANELSTVYNRLAEEQHIL